jgi:uncharacterized protein with von Willebrand factor type A (vWA) domain
MTVEEERRLAREIPRILEELRLRHSRRYRRAPRGRLWMKRAIRENLGTGGVPFRIPMRGPVRRKARIVMIVDVSWSVVRASGLFLMLALELLRLDRRVRVHLFVDHPVDATDALARWLRAGPRERPGPGAPPAPPGRPGRTPAGRAAAGTGITARSSGLSFAGILDGIAGLDPNAASDYGRTFWALRSGPLRSPGRDSVLVVLGDGRANRFDPLCWAFEELASRARRVIWLVPEARDRWGTGDSALPGYLPFCDVAVEARDLEGLAHGVRELAACL